MKIDLQMHTTFSDGHDTPEEIAKLAHEGGLNVISATEHDRVDSFEAVREACKPYGVQVISGVEISTMYKGKVIHILGYNIDTKNEALITFLKSINEFRKKRFVEQFDLLNEALKAAGKQTADIEKYKDKDARYYSHPGLARFLFEEGILDNKSDGFKYSKNLKGTVPAVEVKDAIKAIHDAGGTAVLSHPFAPKISLAEISPDKEVQESIIKEFKEWGIDGLECYQAGHNDSDIAFCLSLAEKYNLLITAGSDWHGYHPPEDKGIREYLPYYINALGDLKVPEDKAQEIIKNLLGSN